MENVAIPLEFAGRRDAFAEAGKLLAAVGLEDRVQHYPARLSGGEQQRVALARAFAASPSLLLADEPTGNLDQATGQRIMALIFDLQRGTAPRWCSRPTIRRWRPAAAASSS